jgi:hypothetical protein
MVNITNLLGAGRGRGRTQIAAFVSPRFGHKAANSLSSPVSKGAGISEMSVDRISVQTCVLVSVVFVTLQGAALFALGRPLICECGYVSIWYGNPAGPETSQHLTDWYTYTHVAHGFLFYWLLWLIAPQMPLRVKLALVFGMEALWEITENTPFIVERYRKSALAQGYSGDSIVNSAFDSFATAIGFALARFLPIRLSIAVVVGIELFLTYMIHDNLTLNIIHLIRPSAALISPQVSFPGFADLGLRRRAGLSTIPARSTPPRRDDHNLSPFLPALLSHNDPAACRAQDTAGETPLNKALGTLLVGLSLMIGGSVVGAGPLDDGLAAFGRGDYA